DRCEEVGEEVGCAEIVEEVGRKEIGEEVGRKEIVEEVGRKEIVEEVGRKEIVEEEVVGEEGIEEVLLAAAAPQRARRPPVAGRFAPAILACVAVATRGPAHP